MAILTRAIVTGTVAAAMTLGVATAAPAAAKPDPRPTPHPAAATTTLPPIGRDFNGGGGPLSFISYLSQENAALLKQAQQTRLPPSRRGGPQSACRR